MRSPIKTLKRAKSFRWEMSRPEVALWSALRVRESGQPTFRRQHAVGPYILDFYCAAAHLCVEVDGAWHGYGDQPAKDLRRDAWLHDQGIEVIRIAAAGLPGKADEMADWLREQAAARVKSPPPQSGGGGPPKAVEGATAPPMSQPPFSANPDPSQSAVAPSTATRSPSPVARGRT